MITATTAEELVTEIRARGGRVYRYLEVKVFVLTRDPELVKDLVAMGAAYSFGLNQGYNTALFTKDGAQEWDLQIQQIERPQTEIVDEEGDVVGIEPARFPGLWKAAAAPRHLVAV